MENQQAARSEILTSENYELDIPEGTTPRSIINKLEPHKFDPDLKPSLDRILSPRITRYANIVGKISDNKMDETITSGKINVKFFLTTPSTLDEIKTKILNEFGDGAELADSGTALYVLSEIGANMMRDNPKIRDSYYLGRRIAIDDKDENGNKALIVDFINKQPRLASFAHTESEKFSKALVVVRKQQEQLSK